MEVTGQLDAALVDNTTRVSSLMRVLPQKQAVTPEARRPPPPPWHRGALLSPRAAPRGGARPRECRCWRSCGL